MTSNAAASMKGSKKQNRRGDKQEFKVKYISSPMKFKATASEFRALVQELTGQDSDAERFVELSSVQHVQKSRRPAQQWKTHGVDTINVTEAPAFSYPCNHSYGFQQGYSEAFLDDMGQVFDFDMPSFDSLQSMW